MDQREVLMFAAATTLAFVAVLLSVRKSLFRRGGWRERRGAPKSSWLQDTLTIKNR